MKPNHKIHLTRKRGPVIFGVLHQFEEGSYSMEKLINWFLSHVVAKIIVGVILVIFAISTVVVNHDELSIKTRFGKNVDGPLDPGLTFIFPFMDEIRRYKTTLQFLLITDKTVSNDKTFEEVLYKEGVSFTSSDRVDAKLVFEVSYQIRKDKDTVDLFVSTFGREESEDGIEKIEKIIADTIRITSRSVLSKVEFQDAEKNALKYSTTIKRLSNTEGEDLQKSYPEISKYLQKPSLSDLGIEVVRLGYRIQANESYRKSREKLANEIDIELDRKRLIEAKSASDDLESERLRKEAEFNIELAELKRKEFEALPDTAQDKVFANIVNKWDGRLPSILNVDEKTPIAVMGQIFQQTNAEQGAAADR